MNSLNSKTFFNGLFVDQEEKLLSTLKYRRLTESEKKETLQKVSHAIHEATLRKSGDNNSYVWEMAWNEILDKVNHHGLSSQTLRPNYFHYNIIRFLGDYAYVEQDFEYQFYVILRNALFKRYLNDIDSVVEFGCGTGTSLLLLSEMYPDMQLIGSDWSTSSNKLIDSIAKKKNLNLKGAWFNMLSCEGSTNIPQNHNQAFLTCHSMEQLGKNFEPFLAFILSRKPRICIHIEPILEFYDEIKPFDQYAVAYHRKRNYLNGYFSELMRLDAEKKIKIHLRNRVGIGNLFHEGYSVVIWSPL